MPIIAIDFEASCLPRHGRSFPIEVGIARPGEASKSWLIRPHSSWTNWDWTEEAENLHGIARSEVERNGLPAKQVVAELVAAIDNAVLVADSSIDAYWLDTLGLAAGVTPLCKVTEIGEIFDRLGLPSAQILSAVDRVYARNLRRHRAGEDALWLAAVLEELGVMHAPAARTIFNWSMSENSIDERDILAASAA